MKAAGDGVGSGFQFQKQHTSSPGMFFNASPLLLHFNLHLLYMYTVTCSTLSRRKKFTSLASYNFDVHELNLILQQNRLRWYGHVLRKENNNWVKKCMEYAVEGARPRGRPNKTWREIVEKDCQVRGLKREDAMDRNRWRKQIRDD